MKKTLVAIVAITGIVLLGITGCATKASVQQETLQTEVEPMEMATLEETDTAEQLDEPCTTLEGVLVRAQKLGKGSFYEVKEADELIQFGFDRYDLSATAKTALDAFAGSLRGANKDFFIELQGHTDDFGAESYNFDLGLARARAVMGYLYTQHGIPLQRMNGFSCGESKPVADNGMSIGRTQNRRVTLVLME
jgi:outer membrane protein OmpA-like peptidoglycan-associated protein